MKTPVMTGNFVGSQNMFQQGQNNHFVNNSMQVPPSHYQNPSVNNFNQSYSNPNNSMMNPPSKQFSVNNSFSANQTPPPNLNNQYNPNNYPKSFPQQNFNIEPRNQVPLPNSYTYQPGQLNNPNSSMSWKKS